VDSGPRDYGTVDVWMPADLSMNLNAYAVAHGYASVDEAVADALDSLPDS
jgi:hypothetical protein